MIEQVDVRNQFSTTASLGQSNDRGASATETAKPPGHSGYRNQQSQTKRGPSLCH
jgi:hypothetical protein